MDDKRLPIMLSLLAIALLVALNVQIWMMSRRTVPVSTSCTITKPPGPDAEGEGRWQLDC